ncbi:MAG: hypothetical protein ACLS7Z_01800 [Christensenellales bacterium]
MRAAFKAVMDGKQVAILAPTTILAQKHHNADARMRLPVHADVLSRFRSAKEQKESCATGMAKSTSSSARTGCRPGCAVQNLGLLIVDGSSASAGKEHQNMKKTVDAHMSAADPHAPRVHGRHSRYEPAETRCGAIVQTYVWNIRTA